MSDGNTLEGSAENAQLLVPAEVRSYEKTPMYSALHWQRYIRQALILDIERGSEERGQKSKLICYVSNLQAQVNRDDVIGFVDLLHNIPANTPIDLLLHTPGGDVDAAEKMIKLVRKRVGDDECLRVIIPDFAKSAGTMMALGANRIVMSDSSELGPIDPQVSLQDTSGQTINHSVLNYLRAFVEARSDLKEHPDDPVAQQTFSRFDPVLVKKFEAIQRRTRTFAEDLLKPRGTAYTAIVSELMDVDALPSHGQMIGWEKASTMGLSIEYMDARDPLWRQYWLLYCHLRLALSENNQRIFESSYVSLIM
jgi:hypothetical protein